MSDTPSTPSTLEGVDLTSPNAIEEAFSKEPEAKADPEAAKPAEETKTDDAVKPQDAKPTEDGGEPAKPDDKEKPTPDEDEAGRLRQADYTRKTTALAEDRKKLEEERAAFEAEKKAAEEKGKEGKEGEKGAAAPNPSPDVFEFQPVELYDLAALPDDADDQLKADYEQANKSTEALNKVGAAVAAQSKQMADATGFVVGMYQVVADQMIRRELSDMRAAIAEKWQGFELSDEQIWEAIVADGLGPAPDKPFFFSAFQNRSADDRRQTLERTFGPELIKRLEDKENSDKAKSKKTEDHPTPPASIVTESASPKAENAVTMADVDFRDPVATEKFLKSLGN